MLVMAFTPDPSILKGAEMFQNVPDEHLEAVLRAGRIRRLPAGERAFVQGDPGLTCHILLHGRIKIIQTRPDGGQHLIRFIGPGEMYGTIAALMGQAFPADALAITDSVEVCWTVQAMRELMARHPEIALKATAGAGARLMEVNARLSEIAVKRAELRIARTLVRLARQAGRRTPEGVEIDFPITRQELGGLAGATLHTVSRVLSAWERAGLIESARRKVIVKKPHALVALAEGLGSEPLE